MSVSFPSASAAKNLNQEGSDPNQEENQSQDNSSMREALLPQPATGLKVREPSLAAQYSKILSVVSLYWFISITMVFVNKSLLSGHDGFDAPFFVTWFQCVVTVFGCYVVYGLSTIFPNVITFPKPVINLEKCGRILPLSIVFVSMIVFNNLCLKFVGVSFYYVGRSLTTVFSVIMSFLLLGQKTSLNAIMACGVIVLGFYLGVDQEGAGGTLSVSGVIFGALASLFVSLNAISTKKVLPQVNDNIWMLTLYNNINATVLFIPLIIVMGEVPVISTSSVMIMPTFWVEMFMGGIFGFAIGYVTGLQIKVTSPLTHNISGTAKAAAQTVIATQVNAESKTFMWWMSNAIVLLGSLFYAKVKQMEMAAKASQQKTAEKR